MDCQRGFMPGPSGTADANSRFQPPLVAESHARGPRAHLGASVPFWAAATAAVGAGCQPKASSQGNAGGDEAETRLLPWCRDVALQLTNVAADIATLRRGLSDTQRQVQTFIVQGQEELKHSFSETLKAAELQNSMAVNRALEEGLREATTREASLRLQINSEMNELQAIVQRECSAVGEKTKRLEIALREPEDIASRRDLANLSLQLRDASTAILGLEAKGSKIARWVEGEAKYGRAAISQLRSSVETMRCEHEHIRDAIQQCNDSLAAGRLMRTEEGKSSSPLALCCETSNVSDQHITGAQLQGVEARCREELRRALAAEAGEREKALTALISDLQLPQRLLIESQQNQFDIERDSQRSALAERFAELRADVESQRVELAAALAEMTARVGHGGSLSCRRDVNSKADPCQNSWCSSGGDPCAQSVESSRHAWSGPVPALAASAKSCAGEARCRKRTRSRRSPFAWGLWSIKATLSRRN